MSMVAIRVELPVSDGDVGRRARRRLRAAALALWPRLDRDALARAGGDPRRIARLVARRTPLLPEEVEGMLWRTLEDVPSSPVSLRLSKREPALPDS
jgi:hypothetical protein